MLGRREGYTWSLLGDFTFTNTIKRKDLENHIKYIVYDLSTSSMKFNLELKRRNGDRLVLPLRALVLSSA